MAGGCGGECEKGGKGSEGERTTFLGGVHAVRAPSIPHDQRETGKLDKRSGGPSPTLMKNGGGLYRGEPLERGPL